MLLRLLVLFHTVAVAGFFGQTGMFGPVVTNPRAGDLAPDLVFSNVLSSPGSGAWSSSNFLGHMTVLVFFPDTTYNVQSVSRGNALNSRFSGKPVQFVWITAEEDSSLLPWLQEHPIQGWVLHDPYGGSGLRLWSGTAERGHHRGRSEDPGLRYGNRAGGAHHQRRPRRLNHHHAAQAWPRCRAGICRKRPRRSPRRATQIAAPRRSQARLSPVLHAP